MPDGSAATLFQAAGIAFFPIGEWAEKSSEMRESLLGMGWSEADMDSIVANPADFLYRRGRYTRYSDGKTDIQWIPKQYVAE